VTVQVVLLDSAEQGLKDLRRYLVKSFGMKTWRISYGEIIDTFRARLCDMLAQRSAQR
jgi:hypothetical protein